MPIALTFTSDEIKLTRVSTGTGNPQKLRKDGFNNNGDCFVGKLADEEWPLSDMTVPYECNTSRDS